MGVLTEIYVEVGASVITNRRFGMGAGVWLNVQVAKAGRPVVAVSYTHLTLPTNREV